MNLSKNVKISQAITVTNGAAGTADINGATCDMQGYDELLVVLTMGAIVATAVTSIKLQESDDDSTWADLADTSQTIADDDDEKTYYINLVRPLKRYARVVVDRGTANATVADALYIQSGARKTPITQGSNVSGELHISPVAGTA